MNYGELKAGIEGVLGRTPSDLAYTLTQADIAKKLKLLEMETTTTLTGAASIALPSDFNGAISVYIDGSPRRVLRPMTVDGKDRAYQGSGTPCTYAVSGGNLIITPATDDDVVLTYWATPSLVDDTDENDILSNYPDLYTYGVLTHHAGLIKDMTSAQAWSLGYQQAITDAMSNDQAKRFSGGVMEPQAGWSP